MTDTNIVPPGAIISTGWTEDKQYSISFSITTRLITGIYGAIAPFADVEIVEQHFKDKPEVSGTARKIAETLEIAGENITSLRLGGIVGHHEVIFGFPYQTVRLIHDSIRREAFGTGAAFALAQLVECPVGFYTFDDLLFRLMRAEFNDDTQALKGHD